MKKNFYLGLSQDNKRCIILTTVARREDVKKATECNNLTTSDFNQFYATNWNGSDEVVRTVKLEELRLIDKSFSVDLKEPLTFRGFDDECGVKKYWSFEVHHLVAVEKI